MGGRQKSLSLSAFFPSSFLGPVHYFSFLSLSVIGWTEVQRWALKTVSQGLNLVFNAWLQRCHLSSNCSRHPPTLSLIIYWWIKRVGQETGLEKLLIDIKIQCPQPDKHGGARVSPRIVGVAIIFFPCACFSQVHGVVQWNKQMEQIKRKYWKFFPALT